MDLRGDPLRRGQPDHHAGVIVRGGLIVLEGVEGAGKSTQLGHLVGLLEASGVTTLAIREPGGTPVGDQIRRMLVGSFHKQVVEPTRQVAERGVESMLGAHTLNLLVDPAVRLDARTEALLFMASRAQLVADVIRPSLERGVFVVADRFFLSTYAYQVAGRGLPEVEVRSANALATGGLIPDVTILLDLPSAGGLARVAKRGAQDRMERSGDAFHGLVRAAFVEFANPMWQRSHPEAGPIVLVDAEGTETEVASRIAKVVAGLWPATIAPHAESNP